MFENEEQRFVENFEGISWNGIGKKDLKDVTEKFDAERIKSATSKYVPIGTVLKINNDNKKYMIIGFNQQDLNGEVKDYVACIYPFGMEQSNLFYLNHDDILNFYHVGYYDLMGRNYQEKLNSNSLRR